jgi:CcmD family protein
MMLRHLHLAYIVTWVIHGAYLLFLAVKHARLQRELRKLEEESKK